MEIRKDFRLARLIQKYLEFDKERVKKAAVTLLFLLKLNNLTGERLGYPSSLTYLLMFINYCQSCHILPNMQKHPQPKDKDKDPLYL